MTGPASTVLLLSTYDLGRQPSGLASPAAWLRRAGFEVAVTDLSRGPVDGAAVSRADLVAFYLPMHTATRLALPVIARIRRERPSATLCAYGLYAPLNRGLLEAAGIDVILGPECEADLVVLAGGRRPPAEAALPRLPFIQPDRAGLPGAEAYARLVLPGGRQRLAGSTDATRGCKHRCRHCPIVPVYDGQFRVVPVDVVLADIRAQVAAGVGHVTFSDPDFLNGPTHAVRIIEALHEEFPALTYDATIKVEHLLRHRDLLPRLAATGCLFVTSAVEAVDDGILERLEKGHTRAGFVEAARLCRDLGLTLVPTFVAFTPWTTRDGYRDLLETVAELDLVEHVAPVQWGIRLLITSGSRLLELDDLRGLAGAFDPVTLTHPWRHPDPAVDDLQRDVMALAGTTATRPRSAIFADIASLVGLPAPPPRPSRAAVPYLDEPWYC